MATHSSHPHAHKSESLIELFRERRLAIRTMDRPLRLATAAAVASVVAAVAFIVLRDMPGSAVYLGRSNGAVTSITAPLFTAVLVLLAIGFGYVLTAATLASPRVAVPAVVIMLGGVGLYTGEFGSLIGGLDLLDILPGWARWTGRVLFLAMALLAAVVIWYDARRGTRLPSRSLRVTVLGGFILLFGGYLLVLRIAAPTIGGLNNFGPIIDLLLAELVFVIYPLLQAAAVDFGEWGQLAGEGVLGAATARRARIRLPLAAACCVALAVAGYRDIDNGLGVFSGTRIWDGLKPVLILAVLLAFVVGFGRLLQVNRRPWPSRLNVAGIVAVCAVVTVVLPPLIAHVTGVASELSRPVRSISAAGLFTGDADVVPLQNTHRPAFSVLVPRGWQPSNSSLIASASSATPSGGTEQVIVGRTNRLTLAKAALSLGVTPKTPAESVAGWARTTGTTAKARYAELWVRAVPAGEGRGSYVLLEQAIGNVSPSPQPLFNAIAHSFRPEGEPPATLPAPIDREALAQRQIDHLRVTNIAIEADIFLLGLIAVMLLGWRVRRDLLVPVLLLGLVVAFELVYFLNQVGRYAFGEDTNWPYVSQQGVMVGVGLLGVVALAVTRATRRHTSVWGRRLVVGLIGLTVATYVLDRMSALYDHALAASRISIWAAVVVLVAIGWDVTMSGDSLTNRESRHLPRATRVLGYLGYVVLLAGTVLYYSGQKAVATGRGVEPAFEPESVTQSALFRIALPVLVLLFLLELARPHPERAENS